MVEIINKTVTRGVAGRRPGSVKGVVFHNTWGNSTAKQEANRLAAMNNNQLAAGFAHYYIDKNTIWRTEDTYNAAWHTANSDGNTNYIGYEVCGNDQTPLKDFLQAEENTFWQIAQDLKYYGLPVNRNTVRLHHEFSATQCPKRSLIIHTGFNSTQAQPANVTNAMKDYVIKNVLKYYNNPSLKPDGKAPATSGQTPPSGANVRPATPSQHDKAVAATKPKHQGNAWGKLDYFNGHGKDQIRVAGWLVPDKPQGPIGKYAYVIFMQHGTGKELTRVQSAGIKRPDVKKAYGYQGGQELGFDVTVKKAQFKGKKVDVILRRANKANGEGAVNDVRIDSIYLSL